MVNRGPSIRIKAASAWSGQLEAMTTNHLLPLVHRRASRRARYWLLAGVLGLPTSYADGTSTTRELKTLVEQLVPPPALPDHEQIASGPPELVKVKLVVEEKQIEVSPGATMWAFTYNGTIPGPLIVVHQNDDVEVTLVNPATNILVHNIDFHAATGAMGGGDLTLVAPGQEATIRFKATKSGVFVYHCAPGGAMVPLHVASGMSGALLVLPRDGLKDAAGRPLHYDRAYYIGEQDFYIPRDATDAFKQYPAPGAAFGDMIPLMQSLTPTFIVYNGSVGALTGDHALTARVGEKVLIIHSQADRDTRAHLIGGHADFVWCDGSFADPPGHDLQSWPVTAGSAVAALYEFREPGNYVYLNHNLTEGFLLGALAEVHVKGEWNDDLMHQVKAPAPTSATSADH